MGGAERVEVRFDTISKPQQLPRRRLAVLSPLRVPGQGMKTVVLIRHGRAEHNDDMSNQKKYPDALLTELGENQATAWASDFRTFADVMGKAELILVSPLRRTIQTACHIFANSSTPMQLCMPAREGWWHSPANQPINVDKPEELERLLNGGCELRNGNRSLPLPGGQEKINASTMIRAPRWEKDASTEEESVQHLRFILATHEANTLVVVTHSGIIKALTGMESGNCMMLECVLFEHWSSPILKCVHKHATTYSSANT